jgi:flagellar biosynthesis/type III secretory pathway M-ring protein FliF/YscJ
LTATARSGSHRATRAREKNDGDQFDGTPDMDEEMMGDIRDYASDNPERVADVVQSWIHEMEQNRRQPEPVGETRES